LNAENKALIGKQVVNRVEQDLIMAGLLDIATGTVKRPKFRDVIGGKGQESDDPFNSLYE